MSPHLDNVLSQQYSGKSQTTDEITNKIHSKALLKLQVMLQ